MTATIEHIVHGWHYPMVFSEEVVKTYAAHDKCPVCHTTEEPEPIVELGQSEWPERVRCVQCRECDVLYYQNPPSQEAMAEYYEQVWNTSSGESLEGKVRPSAKIGLRIANALADLGVTDKSSRILDIGCGQGKLMAGLQEAGFSDLWGTEMSPYRVAVTEARFPGRVFNSGYDGVPNGMRFDVIYGNHVYEHIYDPVHAFAWMRDHLTDKGMIVLSVPDAWYEPVVVQTLFLPHLYSFSASTFQKLAENHGMDVMFWTNDKFWHLTAAFVKDASKAQPNAKNFALLRELKRQITGSHAERIREPWVGDADCLRSITMRMSYKSRSREEIDKRYHVFENLELLGIKLSWPLLRLLKAVMAPDVYRSLVKRFSYMTVRLQEKSSAPVVIGYKDNEGMFTIK